MFRNLSSTSRTLKFVFEATCGELKNDSNFVFDTIYKHNLWGAGSGIGSNVQVLKGYIEFLNDFILKHNVKSIADIGCGDWQYMRYVNLKNISYTGYDVSKTVIEYDRMHFPGYEFVYYDGDFSAMQGADLAICKDVLQHLPNSRIMDFIAILDRFNYVLIANDFNETYNNRDITMGQARCVDLRKEPFNLQCQEVYRVRRMPENPDIVVMLVERGNTLV